MDKVCLDPVLMGTSSFPYLVDFIQEKVPVRHDDVPPGAAHLLGNAHRTLCQLKNRAKFSRAAPFTDSDAEGSDWSAPASRGTVR